MQDDRKGYYGWMGYGGSIFQWQPEMNIGFSYVPLDIMTLDECDRKGACLQEAMRLCVQKLEQQQASKHLQVQATRPCKQPLVHPQPVYVMQSPQGYQPLPIQNQCMHPYTTVPIQTYSCHDLESLRVPLQSIPSAPKQLFLPA